MPGRCPSCNQTYNDETQTFCANDGTPLIRQATSPYDPQAGMYGGGQPPPGNYPPPPPPQAYYPGAQQQPGGQAPPPPGWQPPYGQQQQQYSPPYGAPPAGGSKNKMPLIIAALALVLIGGGVGLYFLLRDNSSSTTTTTTTTGGSYTEDEKHRLFQAVGMTGDNALIEEVAQKIGLADEKGMPNSLLEPFVKEHPEWAKRNLAWVREHLDPQKARAYVMANK